MSNTIINTCSKHTSHLFKSPLCSNQSLTRKVINIAFHILTLGIPFLFYHVISYCCCRTGGEARRKSLLLPPPSPEPRRRDDEPVTPEVPVIPKPVEPIPSVVSPVSPEQDGLLMFPMYDGVSVDAVNAQGSREVFLQFARDLLEKYSDIQEFDWAKEKSNCPLIFNKPLAYLPYNRDITRLMGIMRGPLWDNLVQALKDNVIEGDDTWKQDSVLRAADMLLQVSMAIFIMTKDDFPGIEHPKTKAGLEQIVSSGEYYQNRSMYCVWELYTLFKSGIIWGVVQKGVVYPHNLIHLILERSNHGLNIPHKIRVLSNSFPEGSCQQKWRAWFNIYCKQFKDYIKLDPSLDEGDFNSNRWFPKEDTGLDVFEGINSALGLTIDEQTSANRHDPFSGLINSLLGQT